MSWVVFYGSVFLFVVVVWLWDKRIGKKPRCIECKSTEIGVSEKPLGAFGAHAHNMGEGGGQTLVQVQLEVNGRCRECGATWSYLKTKTG